MSEWTPDQKKVLLASTLGWTLDAFDFFIMVFMLKHIAHDFNTSIGTVTIAITLTLAMRPLGAFIFGRLADRYGRKPILMLDVILYAVFELLSAFSPNITTLLILRALFGIAMGGEWGIGSALTIESIPTKSRGLVSGLLQAGYPMGYLLASIVFGLFYTSVGWRGMFMIGFIPALLVLYIRRHVPESSAWEINKTKPKLGFLPSMQKHWKLVCYAALLMMAYNFLSHGSQDIYPTFLEAQHGFDVHTISIIAIIYNIGAIAGSLICGALSERIGRRRIMLIGSLMILPILPLWAFSNSMLTLAIGAFLMQFAVQGAWGVIPVHLNEISPAEIRATFPALVYQLGNLLASMNASLQVFIATQYSGNYSIALVAVVGTVAILIALMSAIKIEHKGISMIT